MEIYTTLYFKYRAESLREHAIYAAYSLFFNLFRHEDGFATWYQLKKYLSMNDEKARKSLMAQSFQLLLPDRN